MCCLSHSLNQKKSQKQGKPEFVKSPGKSQKQGQEDQGREGERGKRYWKEFLRIVWEGPEALRPLTGAKVQQRAMFTV